MNQGSSEWTHSEGHYSHQTYVPNPTGKKNVGTYRSKDLVQNRPESLHKASRWEAKGAQYFEKYRCHGASQTGSSRGFERVPV